MQEQDKEVKGYDFSRILPANIRHSDIQKIQDELVLLDEGTRIYVRMQDAMPCEWVANSAKVNPAIYLSIMGVVGQIDSLLIQYKREYRKLDKIVEKLDSVDADHVYQNIPLREAFNAMRDDLRLKLQIAADVQKKIHSLRSYFENFSTMLLPQ